MDARLLRLDACTVHLAEGWVLRDGVRVKLTTREADLLAYLSARPNALVSREELQVEVWDYDPTVLSRAVDLAMSRLRKKIEADPAAPRHLMTVFGEGYRFVAPDEAGATATPAATLAPELSSFVRRATDREAVAALLADARLVTLVGPPGVGKTRLARRVAADVARDFAGGAWFCDLAESSTAEDVGNAVAAVLGVRVPDDAGAVVWVARSVAGQPPLLLVLDNFEQAVETAADTVAPCPVWTRAWWPRSSTGWTACPWPSSSRPAGST